MTQGRNSVVKETVEQASFQNLLAFDYKKTNGKTQRYVVEVYKTTDEYFFGWDLTEVDKPTKTKTFKYEKMTNLEVMGKFVPRFEKG